MNTIFFSTVTFDEHFRFCLYVDSKDKNENVCWNWIGGIRKDGYGQFHFRKHTVAANRISYFIAYKIDPGENQVQHACNNKKCVNPRHLKLGDHSQNGKDYYLDGGLAGNSKIDFEIANKVRFLWSTGLYFQREIGEMFDITQGNVSRIINGETW